MNHIRAVFLMLVFTASMLLGASIAVTPAMATLVTYEFRGVVTNVDPSLTPRFTTSTSLTGRFKFDDSTTDSRLLDPTTGLYYGAIKVLRVNLNGPGPGVSYQGTLGNSGTNFIEIQNKSVDRYTVQAPLTGDPVQDENSPLRFRLQLIDHNGGMVSDDQLHATPPSLSSVVTDNRWRVVFEDSSGRARILGTLDSLTAVPLAAAVILFGTGLVALVGLGAGNWRQKKNSLA